MNVIINLNKPPHITSQQAVTRVKRLLGAKKAGHTGTLDPLATGVLLVCLNEATKITRFLVDMDKKYNARVKLGERTDTHDSCGKVIAEKDISSVTKDKLIETVIGFKGRIEQVPPMYSAVKIGGETLHKLARKGIEVQRPSRSVEIYDIEVGAIDFPFFDLHVYCSKGTYIRTLCDDIGQRLGTGAHVVALEREKIGFFDLEDAAVFDDLAKENFSTQKKFFCSVDTALSGLEEVFLDDADSKKAKNGVPVRTIEPSESGRKKYVRLKDPSGNLFGIGREESSIIRIERILNL